MTRTTPVLRQRRQRDQRDARLLYSSALMPTLMPTQAVPGGLLVSLEMARMAYLGHFSDVAVLGGSYNSKLVMSRSAVRVRSSSLLMPIDR
jgi:hypothetical protein